MKILIILLSSIFVKATTTACHSLSNHWAGNVSKKRQSDTCAISITTVSGKSRPISVVRIHHWTQGSMRWPQQWHSHPAPVLPMFWLNMVAKRSRWPWQIITVLLTPLSIWKNMKKPAISTNLTRDHCSTTIFLNRMRQTVIWTRRQGCWSVMARRGRHLYSHLHSPTDAAGTTATPSRRRQRSTTSLRCARTQYWKCIITSPG